jgi:hypothetical protein
MVNHSVILRGVKLPGIENNSGAPTVLSIIEQDFIPWFLRKMEDTSGQTELGLRNALNEKDSDGAARLFQPVHKAFNLVVVEAACLVEGLPRLDPKKILKAGATLRRKVTDSAAENSVPDVFKDYGDGTYGWMKQDNKVLGWRKVLGASDLANGPDPDPEIRELSAIGKNAIVLKNANVLSSENAQFAEDFSPLYPASDALCQKLGKTILFGYLPVTSAERSETDDAPASPFDRDVVDGRLPVILWRDGRRDALPSAQKPALPTRATSVSTSDAGDPNAGLASVISGVSYLSQEAGLFLGEDVTEGLNDPAQQLRNVLRNYSVQLHGTSYATNFYTFLKQVNASLVERNPDISTQKMPINWPVFSAEQEDEIIDAIMMAINSRWSELSPGETRYQNMAARYELQAFARIDRSDCGCPPETVWTQPSGLIEIVPWYEGGEAPPNIIELPSPSALKGKMKPNVAFKVPEEIQKFMSGMKLDKLMDGEQPSEKLGWGMICGFSIPIITICAFIVLQIFLSLFHILFWWLPFIRICIPFPKKGGS